MGKRFNEMLAGKWKLRQLVASPLQAALCVLAALNLVALFFCLRPPGGTVAELAREKVDQEQSIAVHRRQAVRWEKVASNVQKSGRAVADFQARVILPKRIAYSQVIAEIQRMSKAADLQERDGVFTEEPIEGTPDLAVLNVTSNFEGSYEDLMHFLHEADRSPMLLILDNLQAAPEQKGGRINVSIRFQAVIRDSGTPVGVEQ